MWPDETYFIEPGPNAWNMKEVWVCNQSCERDGCERTRRIKVAPRTFQRLTMSYGGKLEKIGRVPREQLQREVIKEQ
jgi:hypothetical protein